MAVGLVMLRICGKVEGGRRDVGECIPVVAAVAVLMVETAEVGPARLRRASEMSLVRFSC